MNRLTLTCGLALMDTCWLFAWSVLIGLWADPDRHGGLLSAPVILGLLLTSALATHLLGRPARRRPRAARGVLATLAVAAAVVVVRFEHYPSVGGLDWVGPLLGALAATLGQLSAPVLGFALALYLWWRGVRLGGQEPGFTEVESAFRWGIGRLAVFGLIIAISTRPSVLPGVEAATTPYVVGFFFVSLLTLALGRLESLRTRTRRPSLNTQWLAVLIVVAAGVVLLALLLGQLVSFDVLIVASRPLFDLLGTVLLLLIYAIVIPLSYVIEWLVYLVLLLLKPNDNRPPPEPPQTSDIANLLQRFFSEQVPPELLMALKAAGAGLLVLVALLLVARGLARWRPSSEDADATNEERESLWNATVLRAMLLDWLRRLLRRGRGTSVALVEAPVVAVDQTPVASLRSIRQLYGRLLGQGEAAGAARASSTTPLEHMPALTGALEPDHVVSGLTRAYVQVRYAEADVPDEEAASLAQELEQVQPRGALTPLIEPLPEVEGAARP
jgi:hypothetical protein